MKKTGYTPQKTVLEQFFKNRSLIETLLKLPTETLVRQSYLLNECKLQPLENTLAHIKKHIDNKAENVVWKKSCNEKKSVGICKHVLADLDQI